ncbi:MAG: BTAD domain-containing putative transcriptional regulator [Fimbriimonas sp.]|nr:BTAD domain-containing putative transcriptional regulator [Fimbriimonas sp.]
MARNKRVGRDELAELLWPEDFIDQSRARFRQELLRLRKHVGDFGKSIESDREWVGIESGILTTDVELFDQWLLAASTASNPAIKANYLSRAVSLFTGPFLEGSQEPWVQIQRRAYLDKARSAWIELAEAFQTSGDRKLAMDAAGKAVLCDPLDSVANSLLIRLLLEQGQSGRAKQAFLRFDRLVFQELGIHPPDSMQVAALSATQVSGDDESQESAALGVVRPLPLYGRDDLLNAILNALARHGAMVTVVGMIGSGKSHLIQEAAWQFSRSYDMPIQFGAVPSRVPDGLYVIDYPLDEPVLADAIQTANQLGWRVLAESRTRLASGQFEEVLVSVLTAPPPDDSLDGMLESPSVRLLTSQAWKQGTPPPTPQAAIHLSELARKLGGLPSALKFFASRLMLESPADVLDSLDAGLKEWIDGPGLGGESVQAFLDRAFRELPATAKSAWIALSLLESTSSSVASEIASSYEDPGIWHFLARLSLISIIGNGSECRYSVPGPIARAVRQMADREALTEIQEKVWRTLAKWTYVQSRSLFGIDPCPPFNNLVNELDNIKAGIAWCTLFAPDVAAYFVVGAWRTVWARGHPAVEAELLFRAAKSGAHYLEPIFAGEAWIGAAIALAASDNLELSEQAFLASFQAFGLGHSDECVASVAWAQVNFASEVLSKSAPQKAIELLKSVISGANNDSLRILAQSEYARVLACAGLTEESIQVGEAVFAERCRYEDATNRAIAYVDLGEIYQRAARVKEARPLVVEGIRRLREVGIQESLLIHLIYLGEMMAADEIVDWTELHSLLIEANGIAVRIGSKMKQLEVARLRMFHASRTNDLSSLVAYIEQTFLLTQSSQSRTERERSLRLLATELSHHNKVTYAQAIHAALGDVIEGVAHPGWASLLSTQSHDIACVLAVVMAKESLAADAKARDALALN